MIARPRQPLLMLSAETCAALEETFDLRRLRVRMRGSNPVVAQELLELREVALEYELLAEAEAPAPEVAPALKQWLSTTEVAEMAMVSDSAVRLACRVGRIEAEVVAGKWRIGRGAAEDYRAARAA